MSKIAVVGVARTASTRMPNKVLFDLGGKPAFVQAIERATYNIKADYVFIACTMDARDDPIEHIAKQYGIECFRGAIMQGERCVALANQLGLKPDDWWMGISCDVMLGLNGWENWAIQQVEEYNCDHVVIDLPEGSLGEAFWVSSGIIRWGTLHRLWREGRVHISALDGTSFTQDAFHIGARKYLIIHLPPEYLIPWHWGALLLDHPVQALVLKEIYRQLYQGRPIEPLEVYNLFQREPRIAQMIPLSLPMANQPIMPRAERYPELASIRLNAECIDLTWNPKRESLLP